MTRRNATKALAVMLAVSVLPGTACYQYSARELTELRPSETVHVTLSPEAAVALKPAIGPNASTLDGRVLAVEPDHLRIALTQIERTVGPEEFLQYEPVDVPLAGTSTVSVRRFDGVRTFLAVGGIIGSAIAAAAVAQQPTIATVRGGPGSATR